MDCEALRVNLMKEQGLIVFVCSVFKSLQCDPSSTEVCFVRIKNNQGSSQC